MATLQRPLEMQQATPPLALVLLLLVAASAAAPLRTLRSAAMVPVAVSFQVFVHAFPESAREAVCVPGLLLPGHSRVVEQFRSATSRSQQFLLAPPRFGVQ